LFTHMCLCQQAV